MESSRFHSNRPVFNSYIKTKQFSEVLSCKHVQNLCNRNIESHSHLVVHEANLLQFLPCQKSIITYTTAKLHLYDKIVNSLDGGSPWVTLWQTSLQHSITESSFITKPSSSPLKAKPGNEVRLKFKFKALPLNAEKAHLNMARRDFQKQSFHHCIQQDKGSLPISYPERKENLASIWHILFLLHWIGRNQVIHIRILGPAHHIIQTTDISFQSFTISASPFIQIVCTSTILVVLNFKCPRYIYSLRRLDTATENEIKWEKKLILNEVKVKRMIVNPHITEQERVVRYSNEAEINKTIKELLGENLSSLKGKTHQKPLVLSFFSTLKDPSRKSWNGHKGISMGGFEEGAFPSKWLMLPSDRKESSLPKSHPSIIDRHDMQHAICFEASHKLSQIMPANKHPPICVECSKSFRHSY
ncbi:hypothetical protein SDJN02_11896, partial [Cucurbita argyrosperma subsp. argyrosperma]